MRKIVVFFLAMILGVILMACESDKTETSVASDIKMAKPIQSFGNQRNQREADVFIGKGRWAYGAGGFVGEGASIAKFRLEDPKNKKVIYDDKGGGTSDVFVLDDWIFFLLEDEGGFLSGEASGSSLYKIKKDGSKKTKLISEVEFYVPTEKDIYYASWDGNTYVMNLDGDRKRKVLIKDDDFLGIDSGWIYYGKTICEEEDRYDIYRKRPDGTEDQIVFKADGNAFDAIIENNQIFFTRYKENEDKTYLIKKTINGEETVLTTIPDIDVSNLNKEGAWLFYNVGGKVYKLKVTGAGGKRLVYSSNENYISSILLYDGDVLLSTYSSVVYIKQDGTKIKLEGM